MVVASICLLQLVEDNVLKSIYAHVTLPGGVKVLSVVGNDVSAIIFIAVIFMSCESLVEGQIHEVLLRYGISVILLLNDGLLLFQQYTRNNTGILLKLGRLRESRLVSRNADQIQRQCSLFSIANTAIKGDFETIALAPNKGLLIQEGNSNSPLLQ